MFLVHLHLQKSSKKLSNRSCITSQTSHPLLLLHLGGALKEACGHVGRYNLTSLALVKSSTFPYCYVYAPDWLLACQTIINWHHTCSHTHTHKHRTSNPANPPSQLVTWLITRVKNKNKTKLTDRIISFTRLIKTFHNCHGSLEIISGKKRKRKQPMKIN